MMPRILTRAICVVPGAPMLRPPSAIATAPTAAIATRTATTRQNTSFRRIRRRSTIWSASKDMDGLPGQSPRSIRASLQRWSRAVNGAEDRVPIVATGREAQAPHTQAIPKTTRPRTRSGAVGRFARAGNLPASVLLLGRPLLERGAENVAQGRAGIGGAVL